MSVLIKQAESKILFGTDPEGAMVYIRDGKEYALPPYFLRTYRGLVPFDWDEENDRKHPKYLHGEDWTLIEDGSAWEMTVRPSHNPKELFDRIQECAQAANKMLSQFEDDCIPLLQFLPTVNWDVERWQNESQDFYMSTRFGCDPSNNALEGGRKIPELDAKNWPYRYTGGHIHISGSPKIFEEYILAVQCQILTSGCAAIANSDRNDLDKLRTAVYGIPGNYRLQNYGRKNPFGPEYAIGFEYRTPSSRWCSSWNIAKEVFKWAEIGVKNLLETSLGLELTRELVQEAADAVISANQEVARQILTRVESKL